MEKFFRELTLTTFINLTIEIMEIRTVEQTKIYKLLLNPMTDRVESVRIAAISFDKEKLIEFYNNQKCDPYKDGQWNRSFKEGGGLDWFNPAHNFPIQDHYGLGVEEEWVSSNNITNIRENFLVIE